MTTERVSQLEQALMAVIAAAGKMGLSSEILCAQAVGGLMSDRYWIWANAHYAQGAADEIDNALSKLVAGNSVQSISPLIDGASDVVMTPTTPIIG